MGKQGSTQLYSRFSTALVCAVLSSLAFSSDRIWPWKNQPTNEAETKSRASMALGTRPSFGELPPSFEVNVGQVDERAKFLVRGGGGTAFLTETGAVFAPVGCRNVERRASGPWFQMELVGANRVSPVGENALPGKVNYFIGNESSKWHGKVSTYRQVKYPNIYPGIDLVYYGNQQQLEYDLIVAPRSDPSAIRLRFEHVDTIIIDPSGDLLVGVAGCEVKYKRPRIYQDINGQIQAIEGGYKFDQEGLLAFRLNAYDSNRRLVIDPALVYSTYLGGSRDDSAIGVAVDQAENIYVVGHTQSVNFPTSGPVQSTYGGVRDAFVFKLSADGSQLLYSTYLGGNDEDYVGQIAVDAQGNASVVGTTYSRDFPTVNAFQATLGGGRDAFVAKLNADGSQLLYSTYLGGSDGDSALGVAVDASANVYVAGETSSANFPTVAAFQPTLAGLRNGFVSKFDETGSNLVYSTYLGGTGADLAVGIAVDDCGNAYITGNTSSSDFPTVKPLQPSLAGSIDAFLTRLNPDGTALFFSTYLGGSGQDFGRAVAVDRDGNAYLTGWTLSRDFPTVMAVQPYHGGQNDAFVTKVYGDGSAIQFSTFLGGASSDSGNSIAVDADGNSYVVGYTGSDDFPNERAIQTYRAGSSDAFVAKLSLDGSALAYSTYFGGSSSDVAFGVAVGQSGSAYIVGHTRSRDFPLVTPMQDFNAGEYDVFVAKIASQEDRGW